MVYPHASTAPVTRYRIDVIASGVGDVVRSAGGLLCDRAVAGWDVNVCLTDSCDLRPLRILGAGTISLDSVCESIKKESWAQTLAVAVDVLATDTRVHDIVIDALDRGAEVRMWGDRWPAELDCRVEDVQYRLSTAARAFKSHALAAAARGHQRKVVSPTEKYRGRAPATPLPH